MVSIINLAQWLQWTTWSLSLLTPHLWMFIFLVVSCFVFIHRYSESLLYTSVKFQAAPLIQEPSQEELDLPPPRRQFLEDSEDQSRRSYRYTHLLDGQLIPPAAAAECDCFTIPRALQFNSLNTSGDRFHYHPHFTYKASRTKTFTC